MENSVRNVSMQLRINGKANIKEKCSRQKIENGNGTHEQKSEKDSKAYT